MAASTDDESVQVTEEFRSHLDVLYPEIAARLAVDPGALTRSVDAELFESGRVHSRVRSALKEPERLEREPPITFAVASAADRVDVMFRVETATPYPELQLAFEPPREPPIRLSYNLAPAREPPIIW
jgi:hypothetical protein